jgi:hypothetical protein
MVFSSQDIRLKDVYILQYSNIYGHRGADSDSQMGGIIMASAASLKIFLIAGDNPPETAKLTILE